MNGRAPSRGAGTTPGPGGRPLRIAIIAPPWAPVPAPFYGGIETVVDQLAVGLQAAGHEVLLFTTGDARCPVPRQSVLPEAAGERIGDAMTELRHVQHAYDAVQGYDIVHDHTVLGPVYAERFPDLAVVSTIHGPLDENLADIYRRVDRRVALVSISEAQRRSAPELSISQVIHHGLDVKAFPEGRGDGGFCLFLGRMSPDKGAHRAIEVARRANVPLVLAGKMRTPAERHYFESEVEPWLDPEQIFWMGEVDHERKLGLLAGAWCLLFPIRWPEPFGMVMIEAMACGTPVLAFPEGAAPEVVDHGRTGFLCQNDEEMAQAIDQVNLIDRQACRAAVAERFSTRRMVEDHLQLFSEVLAHGSGKEAPYSRPVPAAGLRVIDHAGLEDTARGDGHPRRDEGACESARPDEDTRRPATCTASGSSPQAKLAPATAGASTSSGPPEPSRRVSSDDQERSLA